MWTNFGPHRANMDFKNYNMRHIVLSEAQSEAQSVAYNHVTFLAILSGGGVEHS